MNYTYTPPTLTVDSVIFELKDNSLAVLLIKRSREPFKGQWALPGGYNPEGETTQQAMIRILKSKVGIIESNLSYIEQLYTFDTIARDPRGHAVSVTYMGLGRDIAPSETNVTEQPMFFPLDHLPTLAYDHANIIKYAHSRLSSKILYTNVISALLPKQFTLTQLQNAYEIILGRKLDKRNFRKRIFSLDVVKETGKYYKEGAHRPAMLYKFQAQTIKDITTNFG